MTSCLKAASLRQTEKECADTVQLLRTEHIRQPFKTWLKGVHSLLKNICIEVVIPEMLDKVVYEKGRMLRLS
jgi:hypothetical protein